MKVRMFVSLDTVLPSAVMVVKRRLAELFGAPTSEYKTKFPRTYLEYKLEMSHEDRTVRVGGDKSDRMHVDEGAPTDYSRSWSRNPDVREAEYRKARAKRTKRSKRARSKRT